jgi:hypothetical protein
MKKAIAGIDLHSNNVMIGVMDMDGKRVASRKLDCDLNQIDKFLAPFKKRLQGIAVESTYNWYRLVDGLHSLKYPAAVVSGPPCGVRMPVVIDAGGCSVRAQIPEEIPAYFFILTDENNF